MNNEALPADLAALARELDDLGAAAFGAIGGAGEGGADALPDRHSAIIAPMKPVARFHPFSDGTRREAAIPATRPDASGVTRLLFVCHGNICRSPMAEFCMKDLVRKAGRAAEFEIASAALHMDEIGNPVYPPARRELASHGIACDGKTARLITRADYRRWDCIVGMDAANRRDLLRLFPGDPDGKISLLLDWTDHPRPVADPWYTRDFATTWRDVLDGCTALLGRFGGATADALAFVSLRERPDLFHAAADWFHGKWHVPREAYEACMGAYLRRETELGWYLCLDGDRIVGGLGVVENDFHDRKDLAPNICAVYMEEAYRRRGIAGRLLDTAVEDLRARGITPVYLLTDLVGFYERHGWTFLCLAHGDDDAAPSRMYVHA